MSSKAKTTGIHSKSLTSKQAARFLGVSEASIKRWSDSGLLPTQKTAGGHRRFRPEDISLMRRGKFSAQPHAGEVVSRKIKKAVASKAGQQKVKVSLSNEQEKALVEDAFEILTEGRTEEFSSLIANLNLNGLSVSGIADRVLCPAMRRVGDLWCRGEVSIATEHVATRTALQSLERVRAVTAGAENHKFLALCCTAEGDFHELPAQLAATLLEEQGIEVQMLGASMPFFALSEAVEKFQPRLICVAATIQLTSLERAVREYVQLHKVAQRAGSAIVLGGAGFEGEIRERLPADLQADSFRELERFVESLLRD